ncbi:hypothetical protein FGO68_gene5042 [Halteria grandinella]|uniref:Uncharacterized protein n=1 Tax=Halteria grandinella TaxID=5974 RepID=A0A8J8P555_HALGN|nr:hypothetical protein FGO68_gene5042 [Halteria grandinella]
MRYYGLSLLISLRKSRLLPKQMSLRILRHMQGKMRKNLKVQDLLQRSLIQQNLCKNLLENLHLSLAKNRSTLKYQAQYLLTFRNLGKTMTSASYHILRCFFSGEQAFPDFQGEMWNKELTMKLTHIQQQTKGAILSRIIEVNPLKSLSFKNFENMLLSSLESEGNSVTIEKVLLAKLINGFKQHPSCSQRKPLDDDPLYSSINKLSQTTVLSLTETSASTKAEKLNIKLKNRLLFEDPNAKLSRCQDCFSILDQVHQPPSSESIIEKYNPQDSQALYSQYCKLLKIIPDLSPTLSLLEQLDKCYQNSRKQSDFELSSLLMKFLTQVDLEVQNIQNRSQRGDGMMIKAGGINQESDESRIKEAVMQDIQKQAENKINERRTRRHDLNAIKRRIEGILTKQIQIKIKHIQERELPVYETAIKNLKYGMANHELQHLSDAYPLRHMNKVKDYASGSKMSSTLFQNLGTGQKQGLKSIVKKQAKSLIQNKTITKISLTQLQPLIDKSEFVFLEDDDQSINVRLIFRDKKTQLCGPPKIISEAVLLTFSITQKQLLLMRRQGKQLENQKIVMAGAIEFDHMKLIKIINEMERSKAAYLLNSVKQEGVKGGAGR